MKPEHAAPATPAANVLVAHLGDESVLLDLDTKHYFQLNATASAIWRAMESGAGRDAIVERLTAEFEVSAAEAHAALEQLLGEMRAKGLVTKRSDV